MHCLLSSTGSDLFGQELAHISKLVRETASQDERKSKARIQKLWFACSRQTTCLELVIFSMFLGDLNEVGLGLVGVQLGLVKGSYPGCCWVGSGLTLGGFGVGLELICAGCAAGLAEALGLLWKN